MPTSAFAQAFQAMTNIVGDRVVIVGDELEPVLTLNSSPIFVGVPTPAVENT